MIKILILGAGYMASEYLKILSKGEYDITVIGRSKASVDKLAELYPNYHFKHGGFNDSQDWDLSAYEFAINTVNVESLFSTTSSLIDKGIPNILLEKPGGLKEIELLELNSKSESKNSSIVIGYNRRFYSSIKKLKELTKNDPINNIHFDFTEWVHRIDENDYSADSLKYWLISNSSHVIDTVFYLIGAPEKLNSIVLNSNPLKWHPSGTIFCGSGISKKNIPFTYNSNWMSAGRWNIEACTLKGKFILSPMEELSFIEKGSIVPQKIELNSIESELHNGFKPGLMYQLNSFLKKDFGNFCSLQEQIENWKFFERIANY